MDDDVTKDIYNNIFFDEDIEEYFYFKSFYDVNKYVPKTYFDDVYLDNINFFNDQKIFHKDFNDFFNGILENIINLIDVKQIDEAFTFDIFEKCLKYLIEVYSRSYFKEVKIFFKVQNLSKIIEKLCKIVEFFPKFSDHVIHYFLENKAKISDFIFSSDESANSSYKNFLLQAINMNFKANYAHLKEEITNIPKQDDSNKAVNNSSLCIQLLDFLISWFPKDVSKNWTKFGAFLEVIIE